MKRVKNNNKDLTLVLILVMVISGIFGFIYETIFYRIELGYFIKRGTTFGPWIPIYAFGGLLIYLGTNKYKENTFYVFIISTLLCGLLEFITGYILFKVRNIRLWDYNVEMLNFGNIGGFICLRSVLFFGLSGIILMKLVLPTLYKVKKKLSNEIFKLVSIVPSILFLVDFIISDIIKL